MPRNGAYGEFGEPLSRSDVAEIERFEADWSRWFREWERDNPAEAAELRAANARAMAPVEAQHARLYGAGLSGTTAHREDS